MSFTETPFSICVDTFFSASELRSKFQPRPNVHILVETDNTNLKDCIGIMCWTGKQEIPFEAENWCRAIVSPEDALALSDKLRVLAEALLCKKAVQT